MKILGNWMLAVGIVWFFVAMTMDTTVVTANGIRVNNIGLIADQQNQIFISVFIIFCGFMLLIVGLRSASLKESNTEDDVKCPFCAEFVKSEAIKCKHCGSSLLREDDMLVSEPPFFPAEDAVSAPLDDRPYDEPIVVDVTSATPKSQQKREVKTNANLRINDYLKWALIIILVIYTIIVIIKLR